MELETRCFQWWPAIICQATSHRETIATDRFCFCIVPLLDGSLNGTHPAKMLFQFFFRMPICFIHWFGRLAEVVEVAELMRYIWYHGLNGLTDGALPIRDHSTDGNVKRLLYFAQEICQISFTRTQQASCEENFT